VQFPTKSVAGQWTSLIHAYIEQRKAALRRVELELDEADEMVRAYIHIHKHSLSAVIGLANGD
jgi:hypothetical protein